VTEHHESPRAEGHGVTPEEEAASAAPSPEAAGFGAAAGESSDATEVEADPAAGSVRGKHSAEISDEDLAVQAGSDELAVTRMELAERTADLQRLQAEFLNYKRRVDRDRELVKENATYAALAPITEVLDTIDRARDHAPLEGGFKAVADQLERIVANRGLTKFGTPGDPFDPTVHEALSHIGEDPDVQVTTCKVIAKAGYRIGDRVVRAAQVLVVDPAPGGPEATGATPDGPASEVPGDVPASAAPGDGPADGPQQ
jgi:molecular chaperone GrpE